MNRRKRKMAQVQHRAAWRPAWFVATWFSKDSPEADWKLRQRALAGFETASGRARVSPSDGPSPFAEPRAYWVADVKVYRADGFAAGFA